MAERILVWLAVWLGRRVAPARRYTLRVDAWVPVLAGDGVDLEAAAFHLQWQMRHVLDIEGTHVGQGPHPAHRSVPEWFWARPRVGWSADLDFWVPARWREAAGRALARDVVARAEDACEATTLISFCRVAREENLGYAGGHETVLDEWIGSY